MKITMMIVLIVSIGSGYAQNQPKVSPDTIYVATQSYGDSIVLRWAPGSIALWQFGNKLGYKVERRTAAEKDFKTISQQPLKPYSLREWKLKTDTTNVHVATAAQMLLGEAMM